MTTIKRSALVMHAPEKMYQLVNDVASYPQFLPWCSDARVLESSAEQMLASIELHKGALRKRFTTRNTLSPGEAIELQLVDGPFRSLHGLWRFVPLGGGGAASARGCKVALEIEFEFDNALLGRLVGPLFTQICSGLVDAFVARAEQLYGAGGGPGGGPGGGQ